MKQPKPQHSDQEIHFRSTHASHSRDQGKIEEIVQDVSLAFSAALSGIVNKKPCSD